MDLHADRLHALALNPVSRETERRLDAFVALVLKWQKVTNLVAEAGVPDLWTRHVADSLQLLALAPNARIWIDLGSGGGFPGLVLACALADTPGSVVHLVESNAKKAAFLLEAARVTQAAAVVHHGRAEAVIEDWRGAVDVVTARAFAKLPTLLNLAEPLLKRGAKALFPKGQDVAAELTLATKYWSMAVAILPSRTDPKARILEIRSAERRRHP